MDAVKQLNGYFRLAIKTAMANALPVMWLFLLQPLWGTIYDGISFWLPYGFLTLLVSAGMWYANRTIPDPSYQSTEELPTPLRGLMASVLQPTFFLVIMGIYRMTAL